MPFNPFRPGGNAAGSAGGQNNSQGGSADDFDPAGASGSAGQSGDFGAGAMGDDGDSEELDASTMLAQFFRDPSESISQTQGSGEIRKAATVAATGMTQPAGQGDIAATDPDIESVQTMIRDSLSSLRLPDDFAFDALSSGDPREQRQAYQSLQQHTVIAAIQAIMPVMQHAFQRFDSDINSRIESSTQSISQASNAERILIREVAAYSNPQFTGMVKHLDNQLKNSGVDDAVGRATRINQMLVKLGVNDAKLRNPRTGADGRNQSSEGMLRGAAALDGFFPPTTPRRSR